MQLHPSYEGLSWPTWKKILFRFFFIYFGIYIMPFDFLGDIPVLKKLAEAWGWLMDKAVTFGNDHFFHVKKVLVQPNGSGDTSWNWAQVLTLLSLGVIGSIIWSVLDRKRPNYAKLNYLLCLAVRYFISFIAFYYGIIKIFGQQMPFPNISQLATPLGDLLPMRLSWMFIGYSTPYQMFSGIMECIAGLLLLYRRTTTFGTIVAFGLFLNVMMLNLCYDIPVKLFSMHMVLLCAFLLIQEHRRITAFFLMNKEVVSCRLYLAKFTDPRVRIARIVIKVAFIGLAIIFTTWQCYDFMKEPKVQVIPAGMYDVAYVGTTPGKDMQWDNIIFEQNGQGSLKTNDSTFRLRYGRHYFVYEIDTDHNMLDFQKSFNDTSALFSLHYNMTGAGTFHLYGKTPTDSLALDISPSKHNFQLAEKQFHWLSESNR